MTVQTISVASLKQVKNAVIGNQSAKRQIAQDERFVRMLVESLNRPPQSPSDDVRTEAAHIVSSLSYGSPQALSTLLLAGAHQALLYAISHFEPSDHASLQAAFARSLRALTVSMAELVGPPQWGLTPDHSDLSVREQAKTALDLVFQTDSLDIYLPLLSSSPTSVSTSIAQLIASGVRIDSHRTAIAEWLPPSERMKDSRANSSRRWEKASATVSNASAKYGGWTMMALTGLIHSRDIKLQEAALYALATLAKGNIVVALPLTKYSSDKDAPSVLSTALHLSKSKSTEVKLAACLCATQICRATSPLSSPPSTDLHDFQHTIIHILGRVINVQADEYSTHHRTRACYILYHLVHDDQSLCLAAYERGCLESLGALIREITPPEAAEEWGEDEAESLSSLREAALILTAALSILSPDIRRSVADELNLLPFIKSSLRHNHYGVRYGACQCIRALSRSVQALRTNLVDSGVGMAVLKIVMQGLVVNGGKVMKAAGEGEIEADKRVMSAALAVVCNCVNDFSPLRSAYLAHGLLTRLVQIVQTDDDLKRDALWAIKNLLMKTLLDEKREVMNALGWGRLVELFNHPDAQVQEQAFNIVRNLSEDEEGIDLIFQEIGIEVLLDCIRSALESADDDVTHQASLTLANLVNGSDPSYTIRISAVPRMLTILHACLSDRKSDIRRPVCSIIYELARIGGADTRKALIDEGFGSTLRRIVEWAGSVGSGTSSTSLYIGSPATTGGGGAAGGGMSTSPAQQTLSSSHGVAGLRLPAGYEHHHGLPRSRELSVGRRMSRSPHRHHYHHHHNHNYRVEEDKKLTDMAKLALDWLEHGDAYSGYI